MEISSRVIRAAEYIIEHHATVREAAAYFGYGKSTLHTDVTTRLRHIDFFLYTQVKGVLNDNYSEKHLRGGESTRRKYLQEE